MWLKWSLATYCHSDSDVLIQVHRQIVTKSDAFNFIRLNEFSKMLCHHPFLSLVDGTLSGRYKLNLELFFSLEPIAFSKNP